MVPFWLADQLQELQGNGKEEDAAAHRGDVELQTTGAYCSLDEPQTFNTSSETIRPLFTLFKFP